MPSISDTRLVGQNHPLVVPILCLTIVAFGFLFSRYQRLRHIPGPWLASLTDLWAARKIWRDEHYVDWIGDLHRQYGPVVRWGPNRVSFAEPAAIPEIYGTKNVFPKALSYSPMIVLANGKEVQSLITIRDEKRVSQIKKHISAGFSQSTWLKQEQQIDGTIKLLIARLREQNNREIHLHDWLRYFAHDTITHLAFSDDQGFLQSGADIDNTFAGSRKRFSHWRDWMLFPNLEILIYKNWFAQRLQKATSPLASMALQRVQERKSTGKFEGGRDLLERYLAASEQDPEVFTPRDVVALTVSTIHAGSETTAIAASLVFANLLSNPRTFDSLTSEILKAKLDSIPAFADVNQLPYLDAVVRESLRISIQSPNVKERTVPAPGATICGTWIPAGTDVAVPESVVSHDEGVFGTDAATFKPERWLDASESQVRDMEKANMPFSAGRRMCVGQHLARIEIKKVVAALIVNFKVSKSEIAAPGKHFADVIWNHRCPLLAGQFMDGKVMSGKLK